MTVEIKEIEDLLKLSDEPELNKDHAAELIGAIKTSGEGVLPKELIADGDGDELDLRQLLAEMPLPGRIKAALFGNQICRSVLIRDGSKLVPQFVLKNPRLTLKEVEEFSRNPYLADHVLRAIAGSKSWMKSSLVKFNIVTNPKTPQDIAIKWLRYVQPHEMKRIAKSKNIPQVVANTARKLLG